MESAGVARAAQEAGVPAIFARVVVDDAEVDLPLDFSRIVDGDGRVRAAAFVGALVRRPWALRGLFDLRRRTNKALLSMTSFFCAFVESGHADEDSRQDQAER